MATTNPVVVLQNNGIVLQSEIMPGVAMSYLVTYEDMGKAIDLISRKSKALKAKAIEKIADRQVKRANQDELLRLLIEQVAELHEAKAKADRKKAKKAAKKEAAKAAAKSEEFSNVRVVSMETGQEVPVSPERQAEFEGLSERIGNALKNQGIAAGPNRINEIAQAFFGAPAVAVKEAEVEVPEAASRLMESVNWSRSIDGLPPKVWDEDSKSFVESDGE